MEVSVRDLRNSTAKVIAAVEAGTRITLTVHGRPVADIVPRHRRQERRPSDVVYDELDELSALAAASGVHGRTDVSDYDSGLTSDDFWLAHALCVVAQDADFEELQAAEPRLTVELVWTSRGLAGGAGWTDGPWRVAVAVPMRGDMSAPPPDGQIDPGSPGASAWREHDRRRANRERRVREKHPTIGGVLLASGGAPSHERAWARGAEGEERVARELGRRLDADVVVLHDRAMGKAEGNIDHLAVAPSGVWVIDSKRYAGRAEIQAPLIGRAKLTVGGRDETKLVDGVRRQVERVEEVLATIAADVSVHGALCFVDTKLPLIGTSTFAGVLITDPRRLAKKVGAGGPVASGQVLPLAKVLAAGFPAA